VALLAGPQPSGESLVGVRASTREAWQAWLSEHAVEERATVDDYGREQVHRTGRDLGPHVMVRWVPPRAQSSNGRGGRLGRDPEGVG
jgi:hypothetical protein